MGDAINFGPAWLRKGPGLGGGPPHSNNNNSISSGGGGGGGGHSHSNSIQTNSNSSSSSNSNNNNNNSSSSGSAGGGGGGGSSAALTAANAAAATAAAAASTTTRYALAEFRYGREEMLALFDVKSVKTPEILVNFKNLFVEKVQCPLALIPCTDDDVVPEPDTRRIWQSRSISLGVPGRGARGGSVDRGRGRGRGFLTGYQRSTSFYDDEARGVGRGERPWLERNGTGGGGPLGGSGSAGGGGSGPGGPGDVDWNSSSSSSPRKEFGVRARTANMDSWRRSRPDDEPSTTDWRSGSGSGGGNGLSTSLSGSSLRDKWSRSTSWREEDSGIGDGPGGRPLNSLHSSSSSSSTGGYKPRMSVLSGGDLNTSGGGGGPASGLRRHWDTEDQLPEWATENPSDYGGSFDASGAFHDSDNDVDGRLEDDGGKENHVDHRHHNQRKEGSSGASSRRSVPSSKEGSAAKDDLPNHVRSEKAESEEDAGSKKKVESVKEAKVDDKQKTSEPEPASKPKEENETGGSPVREHAVEHPKPTTQPNEVAAENDTSKTAASSQSNSRDGSVAKPSEAPSEASEQPQQQQQQIPQEPKKSASSSSVDRMQEVADDMVAQLIMDDEYTGSGVDSEPVPVVGPSRSLDKSPVLGGQIPINLLLSSKDPVAMQQLFGGAGAASSRMLHGLGGGPQIPPPIPHPGTDIWYYRDPQGKVQGPFPASEMTEWYRAGYFDDSLSVRRACDEIYTTLGSLVALCGGAIPFLNSMNIPPIKANSSKQPQQPQPPQGPPASSFQQQQQQKQHLQQQQQQQQQPPLDSDLSAQFQFSKKLHLLRQQSLIMQKLASAEGWQLLSQEQQNAIIAQHMAQLQLTDGVLISPTPPAAAASAANATNPPNPASIFGGQPPQDSLVNLKQVQQQQQQQQGPGQPHPVLEQLQKSNSLSNAFQKMPDFGQPQPGGRPLLGNLNVDHTAAGHDNLGQLIHNINFNHQPPVQTLPGLGTNMLLKHNLMGSLTPQQAQQQQQQQSQAPKPNQLENDPIQSLLMQLSMHKQQQQQPQPQPTKTPVELMSTWMQNATIPPQPQQQQQQPQARPLSTGWGDLLPTSGGQSAGPFGPHTLGGHPLVNTSMANEPQAPSVVSLFKHHQQAEKQQQQQQNQDKLVNDSQQQQMHQQQQQQQHHHHHQQQQQQQQQQANHQPFERTQQKLDSIAAQQQQQQQQQQNHQPFERTQQKLDSIAAQQQQLQQQQQQQQQQYVQQQKQQPAPAKDERKEQQELLIQQQQQQQQQQQHLHQQQQLQQAINKQAEKSTKPAQNNKMVNNVEAIEKQMQQNQQQPQQQPQMQEVSGKLQKGGNKKPKQQQQQPQPDDDQGEFINMKKEMEEKKRQKELKKQQQEEAKRKQLEEKKKLEELEAQKKAKLLEVQRREAQKIQEQQQQQQQQPLRPVTKVAPWSASVAAETAVTGPSLAEIQKAERERLKALARQEQSLREQQQQQELVELQSQLDSKLKWNSQTLPPQNIKSLAEIQAEEAAAAERNREKNAAAITAAAIAASSSKPSKKDDLLGTAVWQSQSGAGNSALTWNAAKLWGNSDEQNSNSVSSGGFWEEPNPSNKNAGRQKHHQQQQQQQQQQAQQNQKQLLAKSKTMGSISTASSSNAVAAAKQHQQKQQQQQQQQQQLAKRGGAAGNNKNAAAAPAAGNGKERAQHAGSADQTTHEFTGWCTRALTSLGSNVDIPTFVGFLQDIESPFEVKDYIRLYLGETKDCAEFAKQFLERRSKYKNQMRQKNAHIDDMCKPAPAINPSSNDFQEIKGKNKKIKKNKMTKLDNRILGFSVTAAPDRLNVGDRDYGDNA